MACRMCGKNKLSKEFPPKNVTQDCLHPILICMRCTMKSVKETCKCPHPGCNKSAYLTDPMPQFFQAILDDMFKEYSVTNDYAPTTTVDGPGSSLTVSLLTGETLTFFFNPDMDVLELKSRIKKELHHDVKKQKLLYNDNELKDYMENGSPTKLCDFEVKENATVLLVVLLFAIPEHFNKVVFDLFWENPSKDVVFLDASCLLFSGKNFYNICDYEQTKLGTAICHSGDITDDTNGRGHHTLQVTLKEIPSSVTHLFFTLSAWGCQNLSKYSNPSLKFYEEANPEKDLCKTTFQHAGANEAVIMCSMSRGKYGTWEIFESGKCSSGNTMNYGPLKKTIETLITQRY